MSSSAYVQILGLNNGVNLPAYKGILVRSGEHRAMCPMRVLILDKMKRQHRIENTILEEDNAKQKDNGVKSTVLSI